MTKMAPRWVQHLALTIVVGTPAAAALALVALIEGVAL